MEMIATVISIDPRGLLVRDSDTGNEVFVNFSNPNLFSPGDEVRITYNGIMSLSIPPQITASSIVRSPSAGPAYSEIRRATILQVMRNVLVVRDPSNFRQVTVNYPYAHHFCVRQRVNIQYETAFINGGLTINANEVIPIC